MNYFINITEKTMKLDKKRKIIKQKLDKYTIRIKIPLISKNNIKYWYYHYFDIDIWWERFYLEKCGKNDCEYDSTDLKKVKINNLNLTDYLDEIYLELT